MSDAITVINRFVLKPGRLDKFIQLQQQALPQIARGLQGWRGTRLYRGTEADTAVLVSAFASREDFERFQQSEVFAAHRQRLLPLVERAEPGVYAAALVSGDV